MSFQKEVFSYKRQKNYQSVIGIAFGNESDDQCISF